MKRSTPLVPVTVVALALATLLAGPGCMVGYQPMGANGGHTFNRTGPDTFDVTFQSNTNLFEERLRDFCLLRAAEITREFGYDYFTVEGELYGEMTRMIPTTNTTTVTTPVASGTGSGGSSGSGGNSGSGSGSSGSSKSKPATTTTTVSTTTMAPVGLPNFTLRIRCFKTYPRLAHVGAILEANSVREELAAKYEIVLN